MTARDHLKQELANLQAALEAPWRGVRRLQFGSWHIRIVGGSSFGDDPNAAYTAADAVVRVESVWSAVGFQWPAGAPAPGTEGRHPVQQALVAAQEDLVDAAGQYADDARENPPFSEVDGAIQAFIDLNPPPRT